MSKPDDELQALEAKISALKEATAAPQGAGIAKAEGDAMRIVSDFVAATIVGVGLGYAFDWWQDTLPWGTVVGLMIGSAAGVRVMWQREGNTSRKKKTTKT
ncbi:MAG: AtpZ/AtpI family protein [Alphaproteobacteria bacterium]|nr:AtpZ/AtpI family protein [Alphaproteobacteria bacterium]